MGLRHPDDNLIQDYIDGNLSRAQRKAVELLFEHDPTAKVAADQYQMIQKSLPEPKLSEGADLFVDSIMDRLPKKSRLPISVRQFTLGFTAVLFSALALIVLADLSNLSGWFDKSIFAKLTIFTTIVDSITQVAGQLNGSLTILMVALSVVAFYALVDRLIGSQKS